MRYLKYFNIKESVNPLDVEEDLMDICRNEIHEYDKFTINFGSTIYKNGDNKSYSISITKGAGTRFNYQCVKEAVERIQRYLGNNHIKTLLRLCGHPEYRYTPTYNGKYMIDGIIVDISNESPLNKIVIEYKI